MKHSSQIALLWSTEKYVQNNKEKTIENFHGSLTELGHLQLRSCDSEESPRNCAEGRGQVPLCPRGLGPHGKWDGSQFTPSPSPRPPQERLHLWNKTWMKITLWSQSFGALEKQLSQAANFPTDVKTRKGQKPKNAAVGPALPDFSMGRPG